MPRIESLPEAENTQRSVDLIRALLQPAPPFQATGNVIALEHRVRDWRYLCRLDTSGRYQVLVISVRQGKFPEKSNAGVNIGLLVVQDILNMSKNY
jgi:hypothetical protein